MSLPLAAAPLAGRALQPGDAPWWHAAPQLRQTLEQQQAPQISAYYRFGDAVLQLVTDSKPLLDMFYQRYGDCTVPAPVAPDRPLVRCIARRGDDPPILLLSLLEGAPRDPASAFLPMQGTRIWNSSIPGWRLAGTTDVPFLAACGSDVLINFCQAWEHLPVEYLVAATLTAQPDLVAVHAASLEINGKGLLLAGLSESGKSTTSLHLAARGLNLLGDEVALIRLATNEILPFRRTANLRSGPRGPALKKAVERLTSGRDVPVDEDGVTMLRIGELFADAVAGPTCLRSAFFLSGFADHPVLAPFQPTLQDLDAFSVLAGNEIATLWGIRPERRALRLLAVKRLLERIPCWKLTVGEPSETAELIEHTMEDI